MYLFFFSSRRRHTRFDCDWSSDVCSSDLEECKFAFHDFICMGQGIKGVCPGKKLSEFSKGSILIAIRRSEEHTSELQSQSNLVCRLLLEKKKNNLYTNSSPQLSASTPST